MPLKVLCEVWGEGTSAWLVAGWINIKVETHTLVRRHMHTPRQAEESSHVLILLPGSVEHISSRR